MISETRIVFMTLFYYSSTATNIQLRSFLQKVHRPFYNNNKENKLSSPFLFVWRRTKNMRVAGQHKNFTSPQPSNPFTAFLDPPPFVEVCTVCVHTNSLWWNNWFAVKHVTSLSSKRMNGSTQRNGTSLQMAANVKLWKVHRVIYTVKSQLFRRHFPTRRH